MRQQEDIAQIESVVRCPRCRGELIPSSGGSGLACSPCEAVYPLVCGVIDLRDKENDKTAGFNYLKDQRIADRLWQECTNKTYFELYDMYCELANNKASSTASKGLGQEKAASAYRKALHESHLLHGEAILRKVGWYMQENGTPWQPGDTVLEDGAGLGQFIYGFSKSFKRVYVVDLSLSYLVLAQKLILEHSLSNVTLLCGNVERLPIKNGTIDFVHFNNMIEHVQNPDKAISNAHRVLAPGGLLFIISPNKYSLYFEPHFRVPAFGYFPYSVRKWLARTWRGVDSIDGVRLHSLSELKNMLRNVFGGSFRITFLPRRMSETLRQTTLRRVILNLLQAPVLGDILHLILNRVFLSVMPHHIALCTKPKQTPDSPKKT